MVGALLGTYLDIEGLEARVFTDPTEALASFEQASPRPALLLADFRMPGMNGLELIRQCKAIQPELRAISISGTMGTEDMEEAGVTPDRFVRKPFMPSELLRPIRELLAEQKRESAAQGI